MRGKKTMCVVRCQTCICIIRFDTMSRLKPCDASRRRLTFVLPVEQGLSAVLPMLRSVDAVKRSACMSGDEPRSSLSLLLCITTQCSRPRHLCQTLSGTEVCDGRSRLLIINDDIGTLMIKAHWGQSRALTLHPFACKSLVTLKHQWVLCRT